MPGCIILNPRAGSAGEVDRLRQAIKRLEDVALQETVEANDAMEYARRAVLAGCDLVVAAGGDGTINEVVNGMSAAWRQARLGILPLGTGNDFARTLDVPTDVEAAVDIIVRDTSYPLDVVCVESDRTRYFVNVSSGGFSGQVNEKLTDELKASWGPMAYLRAAAEALPNLADYHMLVQFEDDDPLELVAYNLVVANARFVAGGIPIAPEALLDDGLVDVVIVPAASMPRLAALAPQIMLGRHLDSPDIIYRRVRKLHAESSPGMWFNTDGELVGNAPVTFTVLPRALRMIVGPEFDARARHDA